MRHDTLRTTLAAVLSLALLGLAGPVHAQQSQQQSQQQAQTEDIPQEELDRYAEAYLQITQVREGLQQKIQNAGSEEDRQSIRQDANRQMQSILQEHEISVQRYREITTVLNQDQEQRQEFTAVVRDKRSDSGESSGGG